MKNNEKLFVLVFIMNMNMNVMSEIIFVVLTNTSDDGHCIQLFDVSSVLVKFFKS